ncbi:hypothetical protein Esti_004926 [Eimeria stiedai]
MESSAVLESRWGRKRGSRRTDGMEWGEQWEEVREAEEGDRSQLPSGSQETIRIRMLVSLDPCGFERNSNFCPLRTEGVLAELLLLLLLLLLGLLLQLPSGEVCSRDVPLSSSRQKLSLRRRFDDKWWKEACGNAWGHKEGTQEDGTLSKENWYDNGLEKQVDRWEERPDGSKAGEKFGSKADGTQWRERWGCSAGGAEPWEDKAWEEPDREREGGTVRWGFSSGSSLAECKHWHQQWREREHWFCGEKFVEKVERHSNGDEQTLKEGNHWTRSEHCDRDVTSWFEERFGVVENSEEKWALKRGADEEGEWSESWRENPREKSAEKIGWNKQGDAWEERWHEKFDGPHKTETWAEKKGSNAQGDSWMETWHEGWGFKSAHKEARDSSGSHRVERWGEQFFDDGSGEKWAQHWQEGPPGSAGGPRQSSGKSWGDRWGAGGVGGHRWGEEWGPSGCRKWAHDTPGRPEGC